jgi:hypothetical protein
MDTSVLLDFVASFTACATVALIGLIGVVCWHRDRRIYRAHAEYRAFVMIAQAKRQVRRDAELERAVCALEVQWGVRRG